MQFKKFVLNCYVRMALLISLDTHPGTVINCVNIHVSKPSSFRRLKRTYVDLRKKKNSAICIRLASFVARVRDVGSTDCVGFIQRIFFTVVKISGYKW